MKKTTIVLLHGYGANQDDLKPVTYSLPVTKQWNWIFPNGLLALPTGGRAWINFNENALLAIGQGASSHSYLEADPDYPNRLKEVARTMWKKFPQEKIILGGFSQGAMLSLQMALMEPDRIQALILLSGSNLAHEKPKPLSFPVFLSHGHLDPILPLRLGEELKGFLESCNLSPELVFFSGGHEINLKVLQELNSFFKEGRMKGTLLKMKAKMGNPISYELPVGEKLVGLNPFLGKKMRLAWTKNIYCISTGQKIKKSYNNGYSYEAFSTLAECDLCIVKPELCHYHKGTCREPQWGETHCLKPHIVYLANVSDLKVGITREVNTPHRWIDQGASQALPILRVSSRLISGLIEKEIMSILSDKSNWRKMLLGEDKNLEERLLFYREEVFHQFGELLDEHEAEDLEEKVFCFCYPVLEYPKKVKSLTFEKEPVVEGILLGIRGQYLIFDQGVFNIRRHQGYEIEMKS